MTALDQAIVVKNESAYGTAVSLSSGARAFEFNNESIADQFMRTEGDPLRVGTFYQRDDRFTPFYGGAAGSIELDVMTKGFGFWLKHMLGAVNTTGPTDSRYTHAGTTADLYGTSFTCQVQRPFHPSGTAQAFTFEGGKVTEWELANSVDGNLVCTLGTDFEQVSTGTSLQDATSLYPTGMENLTWAGGVITIGGASTPVDEISIKGNNNLNVERRKISGSTDKKEPTGGRRDGSFSLVADFDSLTLRNKAASATASGAMAEIVATWTGPTLLGTSAYPQLVVTIQGRFDEFTAANEGPEGISQQISGAFRYSVANSKAITIDYKSADATA